MRNTRRLATAFAALALALVLPACATMSRPAETDSERAQRKFREDQAAVDFFIESHQRMLKRLVEDSESKGTFDVLILSGGGDFGAFGAGFLLGWAQCTDPSLKRPEFDFVAGTSTGSILAPLAFVGTDDAIGIGAKFYSDPPKNLIKPRGLIPIWPWNSSLADPSGLRATLESQLDPKLLDSIREGDRQGRVLACASTNIDFGTFRPFNLLGGVKLPDDEYRQYLVDRMMASAAIPGVFPPVLIKDLLIGSYVAKLTNTVVEGEVEFRFVAIPDDWTAPVPGNFKPETMRALVELGEKMGRDPTSWRTTVPHLDGVGGWTPYTEPLRRPDGSVFTPSE
jgi:hypothetical protein